MARVAPPVPMPMVELFRLNLWHCYLDKVCVNVPRYITYNAAFELAPTRNTGGQNTR